MIAREQIHFDIRHDELHLVLTMIVLIRHLCDNENLHSFDEFHEDVARIHHAYDALEDEDGFERFAERLVETHGVLCNPSRTDEERAADLEHQVQMTFTKNEVLALVGYESLAAATLGDGTNEAMEQAVCMQAEGLCENLGIAGLLKLRGKLFTALRAVAPEVRQLKVRPDAD